MLKSQDSFDYLELIKRAKNLDLSHCKRTIKLAVLADFATQQLVDLLRVQAAGQGVALEIYEADYDSIDLEILNPDSALYEAKPDYIAILVAPEKLKAKIYGSAARADFSAYAIQRFEQLWATVAQHCDATIIQSTYVTPSERAFGNFELKQPESVGSIFAAVNQGLVSGARRAKNVQLCDFDHLASEVGRRNWSDPGRWAMSKSLCALDYLPLVSQAVVDVVMASAGYFVKCVALDLDNTLWGGVIGDDGVGGIILGGYDEGESFVALQRFIAELKRRGIILAVVSKNEESNALLPFREHPEMVLKEKDISVFVANWENKADNLRTVQRILNIGFDSIVFLDDNPFERNIVRQYLPDVIVPELPEDPSLYLDYVATLNLFETASYSAADAMRGDQYREEAQRELVKEKFTNISDYLLSLQMEIKVERFKQVNLARIAQLCQRSNQFNLCTRRYNEATCEALANDPGSIPITLTLRDKFGDYGLISVIILKIVGDVMEIDEYLMSCRVLKRTVEQHAVNRIFQLAAARGVQRVQGRYIKTAKNDMVRNFYEGFGFTKTQEDNEGNAVWTMEIADYTPSEAFMSSSIDEL